MTISKKINSEFDRSVIQVLKVLVPGQIMKLDDGEGKHWESKSIDMDGMAITSIIRNGEPVAKVVYDYETGKEETFLY